MSWWLALGMVVVGSVGVLVGLVGMAVAVGRAIRTADRESGTSDDD